MTVTVIMLVTTINANAPASTMTSACNITFELRTCITVPGAIMIAVNTEIVVGARNTICYSY